MDNENTTRAVIKFAAIDPYIQENIPSPVETVLKGKNRVHTKYFIQYFFKILRRLFFNKNLIINRIYIRS